MRCMSTQAISSSSHQKNRFTTYFAYIYLFVSVFVGGLAFSRILFEWLFPNFLWLGRPYFALPFATTTAIITILVLQKFTIHYSQFTIHNSFLAFSPFLLNLLWLFKPTVDLVSSRLTFAATVWLTAVLLVRGWRLESRGWKWLGTLFVWAALAPVYLLTISQAVGAADTFEFQVVTPKLGIVHPTGYPLYLILGKIFTLLPLGTLAWRLNFASVVYALVAMGLLYLLLLRMLKRPLPAILGAVVTGLTVTFWSQAIIAEVYALHALIVMIALYLMAKIGDWNVILTQSYDQRSDRDAEERTINKSVPSAESLIIILAFVVGLGMTNHVTSVFLIPPAILTVLFTYHASRNTNHAIPLFKITYLLKLTAAFLVPLLLYAYLPLRWQAVNGDPMGFARFVDWVVAGRFQGALQLRAWLDDPTRYQIIGRLFLDNWGWFNLGLALFGFIILFIKNWRVALILFSIWFGYTFYTLNYYVPDLAVFVIPAQIIVGIYWAIAVAGLVIPAQIIAGIYWTIAAAGIDNWLPTAARLNKTQSLNLQSLIFTIIFVPTLLLAIANWGVNDQSTNDRLETWGRAVLHLPLTENGAILADGEKIAPLNYLQVAEGLRTDLDISVWPDEAAYRGQVDGRIADGQTVYLARQLPNLQSIYHLRAVGPLTEVSNYPITQLPNYSNSNLSFDEIELLGYELHPTATTENATAVTLYWQAQEPVTDVLHVYTRFNNYPSNDGQHPANNFYPTNAWKGDEIVSDYHELAHPILVAAETVELQVALAPPFADPSTLDWQTVAQVDLPATTILEDERPYRIQVGQNLIQTADFPTQSRPATTIPVTLSGYGEPSALTLALGQIFSTLNPVRNQETPEFTHFVTEIAMHTQTENGRYPLTLMSENQAICGWMQSVSESCELGEVEISGVALPETAVNFADKIALLNVDIPNTTLQPGGQLDLTLNWLALAEMTEDYTITVQVLDANDRLVGQTDSWPVQGTRPTSQWQAGETIADPFTLYLDGDMPAGEYRLLIGIYLLGNGRRLPIINEDGTVIDNKLLLPELNVK